MSSPDPVPAPPWPLAAIVTTEGRTLSATDVTSHTLTWPEADGVPDDSGVEADDFVAATMTPPATPPTTSAPTSAAHGSQRRDLAPCFDSCISAPYGITPGRVTLKVFTARQEGRKPPGVRHTSHPAGGDMPGPQVRQDGEMDTMLEATPGLSSPSTRSRRWLARL